MPDQLTAESPRPDFAITWWPIDRVRVYAHNPRAIQPAAITKVVSSLRAFGWRQPLVVDGDGVLIVGHVRLSAALQLGWAEVPVHIAHSLTADQVRAYRLADNRTHEEATWDNDLLAAELAKVQESDLAAVTGFDADELDRYLAGLAAEKPPQSEVGATENGFEYQERYAVIIECTDAGHQQQVFTELSAAGHKCRVVAV